jgi:hypothetical protein
MSARKYELTKSKAFGNVTVNKCVDGDGAKTKVYLHGNLVLEINRDKKTFRLDHCGWITPTTATAINTGLKQFRPDVSVFRKKGEMFVLFANGEEVGSLNPNAVYGFESDLE